jgi:hypothetical protein
MQRPAYKMNIGNITFDSSVNPEIISIIVDLNMDVPADCFKIAFKPSSKASSIKIGDSITIELGYEDSLCKVMTGAVDALEAGISQVWVKGFSAFSLLTNQRVNQVYEKQTAGAIVKDLASGVGISVKAVEDGLSLPMYVIDSTKDVYTHIKELAKRCGFDLFLSGDGRLVFKKYSREEPKQLKYGRDIIETEIFEPCSVISCVNVIGESPSSFKGMETAHWSSKKVVEGSAGSGDNILCIEDPAVRDKDTADKIASAILEAIMIPLSGTVKTLGNAPIGLGDTIEIKDLPDSRANGEFEVTKVTHIFSKEEGFISILGWVKRIKTAQPEPPLREQPAMSPPAKLPSSPQVQLKSANEEAEDKRLMLQDSADAIEMSLESSQTEIDQALSEQSKAGEELLKTSEDVKEAASKAAKEIAVQAEELGKELTARKKDIENSLAESIAKFDEYKEDAESQIQGYSQEILKLEEEARQKAREIEETFEEERKKAEGRLRDLELEANKAKEMGDTLESEIEDRMKDASNELKEIEDKMKEAVDNGSEEIRANIRELDAKAEGVKKSVDELERRIVTEEADTRKRLEDAEKDVKDQIGEAKKTAEGLSREAEEKLVQTKEKMSKAREETERSSEKIKKTFSEARDKILEVRKQLRLD